MRDQFFDEQLEQSEVKTAIVANYFDAWSKVIQGSLFAKKMPLTIAYIDLFAGPGRFKDGKKSTPLQILEMAIQNEGLRKNLITWFNDKDPANISTLIEEINKIEQIKSLSHFPRTFTEEVGSEIVKKFSEINLIPTLMFVDPWGYKGLSLKLINSVLKDWACECIFFFNYNRINPGLSNLSVKTHMEALFGVERAAELMESLKGLTPEQREMTIVENLCKALVEMGAKYILPFRFKNSSGKRTSHHLIFVSKHPLGYKIMKTVMANESSTNEGGVASFEFNPATENQPLLFGLLRPLSDLEELLEQQFAGRTLSMIEIFNEHNRLDTQNRQNSLLPFTDKNYKTVLNEMEQKGKITANKPYAQRRSRNGVKTFADDTVVTFPPRQVKT